MDNILASPFTRLFWNEWTLDPDSFKYNMVVDQTIYGNLDKNKLSWSVQELMNQYPLLRARLDEENGELYWKPCLDCDNPLQIFDSEEKLRQFALMPFDLKQGPLIRFGLFQQSTQQFQLAIVLHHIVVDGESTEEFYHAISDLYNQRPLRHSPLTLEQIAEKFAQYHRQVEILEKHHPEQFWQTCLDGVNASNSLPYLSVQKKDEQELAGEYRFSLPLNDWQRLRHSVRHGTPFLIFKTLWAVLIAQYSPDKKAHISYPLALAGSESLSLGAQINTAVFPLQLDDTASFASLYQHTLSYTSSLKAAPGLRFSSWPIFQVLRSTPVRQLNVALSQAHLKDIRLELEDCEVHYNHRFNNDLANSELVLEYQQQADQWSFRIRYLLDRFHPMQIAVLGEQFQQLLVNALTSPETPLQQFPFLSTSQSRMLLEFGNRGKQIDIPAATLHTTTLHTTTLHKNFQQQAKLHPQRIALIDNQQQLSYAELEQRSNQLAHLIQGRYQQATGQSLSPDILLPICLNRGVDMVIAMLAIMKAGAAYLPLDPQIPSQRLAYILADSQSRLAITQMAHQARLHDHGQNLALLALDNPNDDYRHQPDCAPETAAGPRSLAYSIYTSGTTGRPKGTLLEHRGVLTMLDGQYAALIEGIEFPQRWLQFASLAFDAHVFETFIALCFGHTLVIASEEERHDIDLLIKLIEQYQVEGAIFPPTLLKTKPALPVTLQTILVGGESTPQAILDHYTMQGRRLFNAYGPTEASVCATIHRYQGNGDGDRNIGQPFPGVHAYVLDERLQLVPMGMGGGLYLSGPVLAREYLGQPELTAKAFIANPFAQHSDDQRLYRTGDQARWLPNGELEYLGRKDFQVKIRGHRVELAEIEQAFIAASGLIQCTAQVRGQDRSQIVVYYVSNITVSNITVSNITLNEDNLRRSLRLSLPDYMMPSAFVQLETLPMTINGKLDATALPEPDFKQSHHFYRAATTELEHKLQIIWQHILGVDEIGIDDDFFHLGGDSISVIRLISEMRRQQLPCSTKLLHQCRTIAKLAAQLSEPNEAQMLPAEQGRLQGDFPLHPIQHWFFEQAFPQSNHWNQAFLIQVPPLMPQKLETAVQALAERHDMLRVRFLPADRQRYLDFTQVTPTALEICHYDQLSESEFNNCLDAWQSDFDIATGPLWRFAYIDGYPDGSARIYCALHHLIVDAVSWRILLDDLKQLYHGETLGPKTASYRQWQAALTEQIPHFESQREFWQQQCVSQSDYRPLLDTRDTRQYLWQTLPSTASIRLLNVASGAAKHDPQKHNPNEVLLTALLHTLDHVSGISNHTLLLEGHGRQLPSVQLDVGRTVGWFTALYPLHFSTDGERTISLQQVHSTLANVPDSGISYGPLRNTLSLPYPAIVFNYLGQLQTHESDWQMTAETAGQTIHPRNVDSGLLTLNVWFIGQDLHYRWDGLLSQTQLVQLDHHFQTALIQLIDNVVPSTDTTLQEMDYEIDAALLARLPAGLEPVWVYPANSLQQGFIHHHLSHPHNSIYHFQFVLDYAQPIEPRHYRKAWLCAQQKYPILRTGFDWQEQFRQIVFQHVELSWQYHDLTAHSAPDQALVELSQHQNNQPFDLRQPELMRVCLVKLDAGRYSLIHTSHHIINDGWSNQILLEYVHRTYQQLQAGQTPDTHSDTAYLATQRYYASQAGECRSHWQQLGIQHWESTDISLLLNTPDNGASEAQTTVHYTLPHAVALSLQETARNHGLTLNVMLQFAWHKLLHLFSQQAQTIVGITLSGRNHPVSGIENSVGLFINTLPLMMDWEPQLTCLQQLRTLHQRMIDLDTYSYQPLAELPFIGEKLSGGKFSGGKLFQTLFVYENYPTTKLETMQASVRAAKGDTDYPLNLIAEGNVEQGLKLSLAYKPSCLNAERANAILEMLSVLLARLPSHLHYPHQRLSALSDNKRKQLLEEWAFAAPEPKIEESITLHGLLERQARLTPQHPALIDDHRTLSYQELDDISSHYAAQLRAIYRHRFQRELASGELIGLCCERSIDMIVSLLTILKAGAAYIPMDTRMPAERLDYIMQDSKMRLVLTEPDLASLFDRPNLQQLYLSELVDAETIDDIPPSLPQVEPNQLAYVIYTSGTTGKPKGTLIEHRGPAIMARSLLSRMGLGSAQPGLRFLQFSSLVFDAHLMESFPAFAGGHALVVASDAQRYDLQELQTLLQKWQMSYAMLPPALLKLKPTLPDSLQWLAVGGEAVSQDVLDHYTAQGRQVFNCYGPTEDSVCATVNPYRYNGATNIGKPLAQNGAYVLDTNLQPLPVGVPGELFLSGVGLSRGYLNQPALSQEKFIANPFQQHTDHSRLYRTGDIVRWRDEGSLEYLGRNDSQVKIRGHRIELGEIESVLATVSGVDQAVAIIHGKESPRIVCYYTSTRGVEPSEIRQALAQVLPHYMQPSALIPLPLIPMTINGKLDHRILPAPTFTDLQQKYTSAETPLQQQCCDIWAELLQSERIGIDDNFFQLGGNSIMAIQLSNRLSQVLQRQIPLAALNRHPTVRALCTFLSSHDAQLDEIPKANLQRGALSFSQMRLWFIETLMQESNIYHIPLLFTLRADTQIDHFIRSLQAVVHRHQVLRCTFEQDDEEAFFLQAHDEALLVPCAEVQADEWIDFLRQESFRVFDLRHEYPIRARLLQRIEHDGQVSHFCLINVHHISFDGWSLNILLRELAEFYAAELNQRPPALPPLSIQYMDYASWHQQLLSSDKLEQLKQFWLKQLQHCPQLELPCDYPRPNIFDHRGHTVAFSIVPQLSHQLRQLARQLGVTLHSVLLTGVNFLLLRYCGQHDIVVGSPIANRSHPQLESLIGMFVNMLVLRNHIATDWSVTEQIRQVFASTITSQQNQDMPFEKLVEFLNLPRDLSRHPLFQVSFSVEQKANDIDAPFAMQSLADVYDVAKFDLGFCFEDGNEALSGSINYATALFAPDTIDGMIKHLQNIFIQMAAHPEQLVKSISLYSPEERIALLKPPMETQDAALYCHPLYQGILDWTQQSPNDIALIDANGQCSYAKMLQSAQILAAQIHQHPRNQSELIAVQVSKGRAQIIAVLAILLAGRAYVPMDVSWPQQRCRKIIEQTGTQLVISNKPWTMATCEVIQLDPYGHTLHQPAPTPMSLPVPIRCDSLAYVIFTSGSTGTPKGIATRHDTANNTLIDINRKLNVVRGDTLLALNALCFDLSVYDIFGILSVGGRLVIPSEEQRYQPDTLLTLIREHDVTIWNAAPALFELLLQEVENRTEPPIVEMDRVLLSGDWIPVNHVQRCRDWIPNCRIFSGGGVTEASVWSILFEVPPGASYNHSIPYGKALVNQAFHILDNDLEPVPAQAIGKMYISGIGLAIGYYKDPIRTEERFIQHPISGERLYCTGDLGRWLPDGNIEFLGRIDSQVKVNGYRVELGAIENTLMAIEDIRQCALVKVSGSSDSLAAYYISDNPLDDTDLRQHLARTLPPYMVPAVLVRMPELPLNSSGKIDRKQLSALSHTAPKQHHYHAPQTEQEQQLCQLWQQRLGLEHVGISDDFFECGGTSILAIPVCQQMSALLGQSIPVMELFKQRNIRGILDSLEYRLVQPLNKKSTQETLWMIHPAMAGCEVYLDIAKTLEGQLHCLGVDNYNLYHRPLITSLHDIARFYLEQMEGYQPLAQGPVHILGWSMGGLIALELAAQLEARGITDIHLYLLDSFYQVSLDSLHPSWRQMLLQELGLEGDAAARALEAGPADDAICQSKISQRLQHSQVTLFKATRLPKFHSQLTKREVTPAEAMSASDNHIGQACQHLSVIPLLCDHHDIIRQEVQIIEGMLEMAD
ncbi:non-ribosomal peptide synthetase [Xenorhabdus lircayensis]|uniref:Amino acid adenylation domain-containing protein n=1 Tax=Xenorhabdus lircayensis TaxID=2763499 RepID=A0ABS0U6Z9_9GAMM|nr:non-ribosomal peptide synthetase [Xenorhabdus lircayensis]MBI6549655.1 amino acid adenylation domain-containing protein [Xenorhabdus lircayensis]